MAEASVEIRLHPLVVMSIADHFTREKTQRKAQRVIGSILGTQDGREVQILETMEIPFKLAADGSPELELKAFDADMKLFKEAYPTYEILGWYSNGKEPDKHDAAVHKLIAEYNERPLYLLLNPSIVGDAKELPITIYEQQVHVVQGKAVTDFVSIPFVVTADEAERTTVVHCAKVLADSEDGSAVVPHYSSISKALQQLNTRIKVLHKFLSDHKAGKIHAPQHILREIKGLCNRLPVMDTMEFQGDLVSEYNDALLVAYLASITKGCQQIGSVMDRFNLTYSGRGGGGGRGGMGGMGGPMGGPMGGMMGMMGMGMMY